MSAIAPLTTDRPALLRVLPGVGRLLRGLDAGAHWDAYLAHCGAAGHPPMSRAQFVRRRDELSAGQADGRCC